MLRRSRHDINATFKEGGIDDVLLYGVLFGTGRSHPNGVHTIWDGKVPPQSCAHRVN